MARRVTPGLFVPLDVDYADDSRIIAAGPDAELLYVRCLARAKKLRTDGRIDEHQLGRAHTGIRGSAARLAGRLVDVGLWTVHPDGGWAIAGWARWNPSTAELDQRTATKAAAGLRGNHDRWHVERGVVDPDCPFCTPPPDRNSDRKPVAPAIPTAIAHGSQTVAKTDSRESKTNIEDDDDATRAPSDPPGPSTSSLDDITEAVILLVAEAVTIAANPRRPRAFRHATAQNLRAEHGHEIARRIAAGATAIDLATEWSGSPIYARRALTNLRGPVTPDPPPHPLEAV